MNVVYAAEKPSIAGILSDHLKHRVEPRDIEVSDNPDETGSFLIRWRFEEFVLSPNGEVIAEACTE
jgi:hypothetical protein